MTSPAAGKRRMDQDVIRLIESNHEVEIMDSLKHFMVKFHGPKNTPYEGGMWKIRVMLPDDYHVFACNNTLTAFKSPSIGFINRIFHPNIDEASGSVCLDVINQTWTPVFDLVNIFESFLPQLLTYPNAADPLNGEAASMLMSRPTEYERRIKDNVKKYATQEAFEKIRDKGMILSYPPNRMPRGGSTSNAAGAGSIGNSSANGGGAAHALTSASMPPNVAMGRLAPVAVAAAAATTSNNMADSRSSGVLVGNNTTTSSSVTDAAAAASNGHHASSSNGATANGSSNGHAVTNGASHTNATTNGAGTGSSSNSALVHAADMLMDDDDAEPTTVAERRRKRRELNGNDAAFANDDDDAVDDGEASDLSEFSENEADQMEL